MWSQRSVVVRLVLREIDFSCKRFRWPTQLYDLAENTNFLARSIFSISLNVDQLVTDDGALESLRQEKICCEYLAGGKDNCKT